MINVLISEDSPTSRDLLIHILNTDPEIHITGVVNNGEDAVAAVATKKPDVVMMDVHMPKMDGFEATRKIMQTDPVPIVIVSETLVDHISATSAAYEAGAVAFIPQPYGLGHPEHAVAAAEFLRVIKLMAEIKVVRRWVRHVTPPKVVPKASNIPVRFMSGELKLIAIGASTGGPIVLQVILSALASGLNVPVLIVQHIATGFVQVLADLFQSSGLPIHVAVEGETTLPGHVYIAPEDSHMGIDRQGRIRLSKAVPEHGLRPSVSYLFRSVAEAYGKDAVGVLLTGMGKDGAGELKLMRNSGALTIAQDAPSSVVHGMPGEAIRLDAADHVLPPEGIAILLNRLLKSNT